MNTFYLIGMVFSAMALVSAWAFISARYHYLIKVLGITALVLGTLYCWTTIYSLLGYPVHGYPSDGSIVLGFDLNESENHADIWIRDLNTGIPRGYRFPYDPKLSKALKEGKAKAEKENMVMKFYKNKKDGGEDGDDGEGTEGNGKKGGKGGRKGKGIGQAGAGRGLPGSESGFKDDIGAGFDIHLEPNLPEKE